MERSHTPFSIWFWAAYLVSSQTPGMSAVQFQRQLGLKRYETVFQILHKLRAGMVRPDQDRVGGNPDAKTIKHRADGTPDVSGSPLRLTEARNRVAASLRNLLSQAH